MSLLQPNKLVERFLQVTRFEQLEGNIGKLDKAQKNTLHLLLTHVLNNSNLKADERQSLTYKEVIDICHILNGKTAKSPVAGGLFAWKNEDIAQQIRDAQKAIQERTLSHLSPEELALHEAEIRAKHTTEKAIKDSLSFQISALTDAIRVHEDLVTVNNETPLLFQNKLIEKLKAITANLAANDKNPCEVNGERAAVYLKNLYLFLLGFKFDGATQESIRKQLLLKMSILSADLEKAQKALEKHTEANQLKYYWDRLLAIGGHKNKAASATSYALLEDAANAIGAARHEIQQQTAEIEKQRDEAAFVKGKQFNILAEYTLLVQCVDEENRHVQLVPELERILRNLKHLSGSMSPHKQIAIDTIPEITNIQSYIGKTIDVSKLKAAIKGFKAGWEKEIVRREALLKTQEDQLHGMQLELEAAECAEQQKRKFFHADFLKIWDVILKFDRHDATAVEAFKALPDDVRNEAIAELYKTKPWTQDYFKCAEYSFLGTETNGQNATDSERSAALKKVLAKKPRLPVAAFNSAALEEETPTPAATVTPPAEEPKKPEKLEVKKQEKPAEAPQPPKPKKEPTAVLQSVISAFEEDHANALELFHRLPSTDKARVYAKFAELNRDNKKYGAVQVYSNWAKECFDGKRVTSEGPTTNSERLLAAL